MLKAIVSLLLPLVTLTTALNTAAAFASTSSTPVNRANLSRNRSDTAGSTGERIAALEALLSKDPKAGTRWLQLGSVYLRRAFETGDPALYPLAQRSLSRANQLLGSIPEVLSEQTTLALARHQFEEARVVNLLLLKQRPLSVEGRVARFDVVVELGSYAEAQTLIEELVDQKVGTATLARLSYIKQLLGDSAGSEEAMRSAVGAAPKNSFDRAVALGYLGDILLENGKLDASSRAYENALLIAPTLSDALLGEARIAMARGQTLKAVERIDRLNERMPTPGGLGFRADIARLLGDRKAMGAANELVDVTVALFQASGSVVDSELAVLLADRGAIGSKKAIETAKRAYEDRQTIFTADALAWSLFSSGRLREADKYAKEAIRTEPIVSSVRWHAAAIFAAVGNEKSARKEMQAAARNPWFSPSQRPAILALAKKLGVVVPSGSALANVRKALA